MSKFGEVVFCLDCVRNAQARAAEDGTGASASPPRRMAVKTDANGDPLCVPCLDLRRANRNAAFFRERQPAEPAPQDRGGWLAGAAQTTQAPKQQFLRIASAVRIPRERDPSPPTAAKASQRTRGRRATSDTQPNGTRVRVFSRTSAREPERTTSNVHELRPRSRRSLDAAADAEHAEPRIMHQRQLAKVLAGKNAVDRARAARQERELMRLSAEIGLVRARALLEWVELEALRNLR